MRENAHRFQLWRGCLFVLLLGLAVVAPAQRLDDDLRLLATSAQDSQRVDALNRVSAALLRDYPDSSMRIAVQAMSLGRKLDYQRGQTRARLNEARAYIAQGKSKDADAALKVCESEFAQMHDLGGLAETALAAAQLHVRAKEWNLALAACHRADSLLASDSLMSAGPDLLRGRIFQDLGNQDLAHDYYREADRIARMGQDSREKALASEALGAALLLQARNDSAIIRFKSAFEFWKAAGDRNGQLVALTGLGTAHVRAGKPDAGIIYLRDAVQLAHDDEASQREGMALTRLAEAEVKLGQPDSAQRRCYDALALLRDLPDPAPALDARVGIVQAALIRSDYTRAQRHGDTAIFIADSLQLFRPLYTVHQLLSKAYEVQGDYRRALGHFQSAMAARDSLQRTKERNLSLAMEVKSADDAAYLGRAEGQRALAENAALGDSLRLTRWLLVGVAAIALMALVAALWMGMRLRARSRRVRELLQEKDEELGQSKQELSRVSARLEESNIDYDAVVSERTETLQEAVQSLIAENEAMQDFINRSSNDLLGPIARLKGLTMVAKASGQVKDFVHAIDLIEAVSIYTEKALRKVLVLQEIKHGFKQIEPVNVEELILDIRPTLKELPGVKYPDVRFEDHLKRPVLVDRNLIRVILENLLENACIFRKDVRNDSPRVDVLLMKEDEDIFISIRDEGIGIPADIRDKVFNLFFRGSERSKGQGVGLYLVARALREIGGRVQINSKEGQFTEFVIRFREMEA